MVERNTVVIDNGSYQIKAGFAKDQLPSAEFPCIVSRYPNRFKMVGSCERDVFIGYEANEMHDILNIKSPIESVRANNWDDMEHVWHHTFYNELRVTPEEHPVILNQPPLTPKAYSEKTIQIMMEAFNTPAVYICNSAQLSLYGAGRTTGIVLETGHNTSYTVPVFVTQPIRHATHHIDYAGNQLTDFLAKSLSEESGYSLCDRAEREAVRRIKETLTHVSLNYQHDMTPCASKEIIYKLPDGTVIFLDKEIFRCPEALFQPSLLPLAEDTLRAGIHDCIFSSINKCGVVIRKHLYANIVMSGGTSLFPGIVERLEKEMSLLAPPATKIKVVAPKERKYLSWIGGASLASLSYFKQLWITSSEYDEWGPSIVHRKSFL